MYKFNKIPAIGDAMININFNEEFEATRDEIRKKYDHKYKWIYCPTFDKLIDTLEADIEAKKETSYVEIEAYGPNTYYNTADKDYINEAFDVFCVGVQLKGYRYVVSETSRAVSDPIEGSCHVGYKHVTIYLK